MFSVFRSFWELNVRRMEPAWPVTADMAEYRLPSETRRQRKKRWGINGGSKRRRQKVQRQKRRWQKMLRENTEKRGPQ